MSHYEKNHFPRGQVRLMLLDLSKTYPEMIDAALAMIDAAEKDTFDNIVRKLLALKPSTAREIEALSGFSLDEVRKRLKLMQSDGEIHVMGYTMEPWKRHRSKIFQYGQGVDAPYPYQARVRRPEPDKPKKKKIMQASRPKKAVEAPQPTRVVPKRDVAAAWF